MRETDAAMVERAEHESTMEEIVVALRETRQGASRLPPFTVVGGQPGGRWASAAALRGGENWPERRQGEAGNALNVTSSTDIADLRDGEIERLLAENARLNERIVFLLKVIEREQRQRADFSGGPVVEMDRGAVARDVTAALEAELRPILLVLLRLLEKQQADPDVPSLAAEAARPDSAQGRAPGSAGGGVPRVDRRRDR